MGGVLRLRGFSGIAMPLRLWGALAEGLAFRERQRLDVAIPAIRFRKNNDAILQRCDCMKQKTRARAKRMSVVAGMLDMARVAWRTREDDS